MDGKQFSEEQSHVRDFSEDEWLELRPRLDAREGGWTEGDFKIWLSLPERAETLSGLGEDYTLTQLFTIATGGPKRARRLSKRGLKRLRTEVETPQREVAPRSHEEQVENGIAKYRAAYVDLTPNDISAFRQLVEAEIAIEGLQERRQFEMMQPELNHAALKDLTGSIAQTSRQIGNLQQMLGITRVQREKANTEDAAAAIQAQMDAIGEWVKTQLIEIEHCNTHLASVSADFRAFPFSYKMICPKCGQPFEYEHVPSAADKKEIQPAWVEEEEQLYSGLSPSAVFSEELSERDPTEYQHLLEDEVS